MPRLLAPCALLLTAGCSLSPVTLQDDCADSRRNAAAQCCPPWTHPDGPDCTQRDWILPAEGAGLGNGGAQSIFAGYADPAYVPLGLSWAYRDIGFKVTPEMQYPYDPARAKKLLAEAGFANGFPLTMHAFQLPGLPEGKAFAEAVAGYWQKVGVQPKLVPVDYPAFRKNWFDRATPGAFGYYNVANRDWIGAYAFLEKQAYTKSKAGDTVNDPEIDGMIEQVMRQTDKEKIGTLMRNVYTRLRSEHYGLPVVYLHSPYAASKTLGKWNPGTVMYDFFIDELASSKR
jgi:ABC-type transport system substrate-binding protein